MGAHHSVGSVMGVMIPGAPVIAARCGLVGGNGLV